MTKVRDRAIEGRHDLSRFVVHLTRDDTADFENGQTARENFIKIADDRLILAARPHCLHADEIPGKHWRRLSVCCFTEVPLSELHLLTREIPGRRIQLSDYGFVFSREFLAAQGAQPALYVNSYHGKKWIREAADKIYEVAQRNDFRKGKLWRLLPYLNAMHEGYDFTWEREWRVAGDLEFGPEDVVCVILPEDDEDELKQEYLESGVPVISSAWSAEKIVAEFSNQARAARRLWVAEKNLKTSGKRPRRSG